jgi:hypothetical protein
LAVDISESSGENDINPTVRRISAGKWMEKHRLTLIRKPEKVLPDFFQKIVTHSDAAYSDHIPISYRIAVIDKHCLTLKGNQRCPKENMFLCVFLLLRVLVHPLLNQQMGNLLTIIEQKKRFQTVLEWNLFMCRRDLF